MNSREAFVHVYPTRREMGAAAASAVRQGILEILSTKSEVRMVFAAAPSQEEFLEELVKSPDIPWHRVTGLHMDEYFGLEKDSPRSFGHFLRVRLFDRVPFGQVEYLDPTTTNPSIESIRYARIIREKSLDIVCLGIGENGHLAFNDPPIADFADPYTVKVASLDDRCRQQQVNDGAFPTLDDVPLQAITLTIPTLLSASKIFAVVPGERKARAVFDALRGPIATSCPASVLRRHPHVEIFLDAHSAALLV